MNSYEAFCISNSKFTKIELDQLEIETKVDYKIKMAAIGGFFKVRFNSSDFPSHSKTEIAINYIKSRKFKIIEKDSSGFVVSWEN